MGCTAVNPIYPQQHTCVVGLAGMAQEAAVGGRASIPAAAAGAAHEAQHGGPGQQEGGVCGVGRVPPGGKLCIHTIPHGWGRKDIVLLHQ